MAQQTPPTQNPLAHSPAAMHTAPFGVCGARVDTLDALAVVVALPMVDELLPVPPAPLGSTTTWPQAASVSTPRKRTERAPTPSQSMREPPCKAFEASAGNSVRHRRVQATIRPAASLHPAGSARRRP
jgi:hypothetical protein